MKNQRVVKSMIIPLIMFMVSFGMITGCNNKKSNKDDMEMSEQNGMSSQDKMNKDDDMMHEGMMYSTDLSGDNEVPAVNTDATGKVTISMNEDGSAHIKGQFSGLSSAYTASHIHMGAKGTNGNVIHPLNPDVNSNKTSGSWDADVDMNDSQMTALKNGKLYVNVHSKNHKDGEIRGQLKTSDMEMDDSMNDDDSMNN